MEKTTHLEIILFGRVQGIGLRKRIKKFADLNNLKGFVENLDNGSVRILALGRPSHIAKLLKWLDLSPKFSKISRVEAKNKKTLREYNGFSIRRKNSFLIDKIMSFGSLARSFFMKETSKVPLHIAIIPDGNRRWARKKGMKETEGHRKSVEHSKIMSLFDEARRLGVKYVSVWGFSTENWKREKEEINYLFNLIERFVKELKRESSKNKIRFRHFGRKDRLPKKLVSKMDELERESAKYSDFNIQLCLDYGGRDEIVRAVNRVLKDKKKRVDEGVFSSYLDSAEIPDVDLIIRTSGEKRSSGFMPFQSAYAEFYFVKKCFPDFGKKDLRKAIQEFGKRKRRFGGN